MAELLEYLDWNTKVMQQSQLNLLHLNASKRKRSNKYEWEKITIGQQSQKWFDAIVLKTTQQTSEFCNSKPGKDNNYGRFLRINDIIIKASSNVSP